MRLDPIIRESEWPPSPFLLNVFSSATKQWEDRLFVREGEAAGTIGDLVKLYSRQHYAAYWHGSLYVHRCNYVTRYTYVNYAFCLTLAVKIMSFNTVYYLLTPFYLDFI